MLLTVYPIFVVSKAEGLLFDIMFVKSDKDEAVVVEAIVNSRGR